MNVLPVVCLYVLIVVGLGEPIPYRNYLEYKKPSPQVCHWPGHCLGKFMCSDSSPLHEKCVDSPQVCNGVRDCDDGSDERRCQQGSQCYNGMLCRDGNTCAKPCDNIPECAENEDEIGCPSTCPFNEYKCEGRKDKCIPLNQVCDGERNCLLGDDEKQCNFVCGVGQYRCLGEDKCLAGSQVCDFRTDCVNGDDEAACIDPCPRGWFRFRDSCYHFSMDRIRTYAGSREFCESMGSYLVTINDQAENDFLQQVAAVQENFAPLWIGLDDIDNEGTFRWLSTNEMVDFENWGPEEPSQIADADFVYRVSSLDYQWAVTKCNESNRFICEQAAGVQ